MEVMASEAEAAQRRSVVLVSGLKRSVVLVSGLKRSVVLVSGLNRSVVLVSGLTKCSLWVSGCRDWHHQGWPRRRCRPGGACFPRSSPEHAQWTDLNCSVLPTSLGVDVRAVEAEAQHC